MRFYRFMRAIIRPICFVLFPRKYYGLEHLPKGGPLIVCSNHISLIDPVFIGLATNFSLHFIAKKEACDAPVIGKILHWLGAFPVDREGKDLKAIRTCMSILKDGKVLGIFPEGTRIINGKVSEAKAGIALIAKRSKAPLLLARIVPKKGRVRPFVRTDVYFSPVYTYDAICADTDYMQASRRILDTIYALGDGDEN